SRATSRGRNSARWSKGRESYVPNSAERSRLSALYARRRGVVWRETARGSRSAGGKHCARFLLDHRAPEKIRIVARPQSDRVGEDEIAEIRFAYQMLVH